jgi:hypothetical protein
MLDLTLGFLVNDGVMEWRNKKYAASEHVFLREGLQWKARQGRL